MKVSFNKDQVASLAQTHKVIPVIRTLFSGSETPLSIFEKLGSNQSGSFLLESAEAGVWSRYSFIGVTPRGVLTGELGSVRWIGTKSPLPSSSAQLPKTALDALEAIERAWTGEAIPGLPPLVSGLVGLLGWNVIHEIESLPTPKPKDFVSPDIAFAMFENLVVMDHTKSELLLVSNIFVDDYFELDSAYESALAQIDSLIEGLKKPSSALLAEVDLDSVIVPKAVSSKEHFMNAVEEAKKYIRIGDVFQVVIGQRFDQSITASALDVYRVLRALNPSPYMYLLNFADDSGPFSVVGSSPEALVKIVGNHVVTHPIAGSRPRGLTPRKIIQTQRV